MRTHHEAEMRISVVIPSRNRAGTLQRCLESIIRQSYPVTEILVVDDHSTDDTADVIKEIGDSRIVHHCLVQKNGAQAARNYGVEKATCEWVAFQDSDDVWKLDKIERQVATLKRHGGDENIVVHGNGVRCDELSRTEAPLAVPLTQGDCYKQLLIQPAPMYPTLLVSKSALLRIGPLDESCPAYQEWDTSIRLARNCRFVHLQEPLFLWVWHAGETISKDERLALAGYGYVQEKHRDETMRLHGPRIWRRQKMILAIQAMKAGLWPEALSIIEPYRLHAVFCVAWVFAKARLAPRGMGLLLRTLTY